jgi:hypothetical protein
MKIEVWHRLMKRLERVARKGGDASHCAGRGDGEDTGGSSERGFASMSKEEIKRITSKSGQK